MSVKRPVFECSSDLSPIPLKRQRQLECLSKIKQMKFRFNPQRLQINAAKSKSAAFDALFNQPPSITLYRHIQWVLGCKFVCATQLKLSGYRTFGMQRIKLPKNMHFYVDDLNNLCLLLHHHQSDLFAAKLIDHCNEIETSVVQSYRDNQLSPHSLSTLVESALTEAHDDNEDDDLWLKCRRDSSGDAHQTEALITVVRIPSVYYALHTAGSFYELCCRVASYLNAHRLWHHPLFHMLFRTIANFDCFQSSLPTVPLSGSLHAMFSQFALGQPEHCALAGRKLSLSRSQYVAFLAAFDCWTLMQYKARCRAAMRRCWTEMEHADVHIISVVIKMADLQPMSDSCIITHIDRFEVGSSSFVSYHKELALKIDGLAAIVDLET